MPKPADISGKVIRLFWTCAARILSLTIPRRKDLWVFGSWHGNRYADNSRALYEYALSEPRIEAVWVSKQPQIVDELGRAGYPAELTRSLRGLWTCARAGVYLYDCGTSDINAALSWHALRINLWHGVPLKRIGSDIVVASHPARTLYSSTAARWARYFSSPANLDRPDFVIATSETMLSRYESAFDLSSGQVKALGQPRTDPIRAMGLTTDAERQLLDSLRDSHSAGRQTLLYAPTFREAEKLDLAAIVESMAKVCNAVGWRLFVKLHAGDVVHVPKESTDFHLIPASLDLNRILPEIDALVTDYSSIFIDYLLLDRPIVFFAPDIGHYESAERGFYDDYRESAPGPIAETLDELTFQIQTLARGDSAGHWSAQRARQRDWYHSFADRSCERVVDFVWQAATNEIPLRRRIATFPHR